MQNGDLALKTLSGDLNNIADKSIPFGYVYDPINQPPGTTNGYLRVIKHNNTACVQEYFPYPTGEYFIRHRLDTGRWMDWVKR